MKIQTRRPMIWETDRGGHSNKTLFKSTKYTISKTYSGVYQNLNWDIDILLLFFKDSNIVIVKFFVAKIGKNFFLHEL